MQSEENFKLEILKKYSILCAEEQLNRSGNISYIIAGYIEFTYALLAYKKNAIQSK